MASLCHIGIDCFSRGYSRYGGCRRSRPHRLRTTAGTPRSELLLWQQNRLRQTHHLFLRRPLAFHAALSCALLLFEPVYWLVSANAAVFWLIGIYFLAQLMLHWGVTAWFPLLSEIVPPAIRGRYFGRMRLAWSISCTAAILLAGAWLGNDPDPRHFYPVLVGVIAFTFARLLILRRLPEIPPAPNRPTRCSALSPGPCTTRRFAAFSA